MARDRLAAIRAQKSATGLSDGYTNQYQQAAPPQQRRGERERDDDRGGGGGYGRDQLERPRGDFDRGPSPTSGYQRQTEPAPDQDRRQRRPSNGQGGGGGPGRRGHQEQLPPQTFEPPSQRRGQSSRARAEEQRSYTPDEPTRTARNDAYQASQAPQHDFNRKRTPPPFSVHAETERGRSQPMNQTQSSDIGYGYDEKGSRADLLERETERYEMQRREPAPRDRRGEEGRRGQDDRGRRRESRDDGGRGQGRSEKAVRPRAQGKTIRRGDVPMEEMGEFFAEISDLQQSLRESAEGISQIQALHLRILSLPSCDDPQSLALTSDLSALAQYTREFFTQLKTRIQALEQGNANLRALIPAGQSAYNLSLADVDVRAKQVEALKERFKASLQRYAEVEQESRAKARSRMERQVRIVNPSLSTADVGMMVKEAEAGGVGTMFQQALLQSNGQRAGAARGAMREVESRAAEIQRIEETLTGLAQLFNDMATLVEAQDVQIVNVEQNAVTAAQDIEKGLDETKQAVVSARGARAKRWWCFGILMVILIIIVVVIFFQVVLPIIKKNQAASSSAPASVSATVAATVRAVFPSTTFFTSPSPTATPAGASQIMSIVASAVGTSAASSAVATRR